MTNLKEESALLEAENAEIKKYLNGGIVGWLGAVDAIGLLRGVDKNTAHDEVFDFIDNVKLKEENEKLRRQLFTEIEIMAPSAT